jgi:hypothetical protein
MTCNKPTCNQGHCDCKPMFLVSDGVFMIVEAALFAAIMAVAVITWRVW